MTRRAVASLDGINTSLLIPSPTVHWQKLPEAEQGQSSEAEALWGDTGLVGTPARLSPQLAHIGYALTSAEFGSIVAAARRFADLLLAAGGRPHLSGGAARFIVLRAMSK